MKPKCCCHLKSIEETGVLGENQRPVTSHWQTLSHNVVLSTLRLREIRTHNVSGDRQRKIYTIYILYIYVYGYNYYFSCQSN
jgi:hypothetical protein